MAKILSESRTKQIILDMKNHYGLSNCELWSLRDSIYGYVPNCKCHSCRKTKTIEQIVRNVEPIEKSLARWDKEETSVYIDRG